MGLIFPSVATGAETTTLAILNFTNAEKDPEILEWGRLYAEFLTIELSKDKRLILVDRNEINKIFKEFEISLSELGAKDRAIQIGKLLGAQIIVVGELEEKEGIIEIRVDLVQPSTGNVLGAERLESKGKGLLAYQGILLEKFKKALNIAFTKIESQKKRRTVAVLLFENKSRFDRLDSYELILPGMLMDDLSKIEDLLVLERRHLDKIIQEAHLAEAGLIEDKTGQKALGADILIGGSFKETLIPDKAMEECPLEIDIIITGILPKRDIRVEGQVKDIYQMEKEALKQTIETLDISLGENKKEAIIGIDARKQESSLHYLRGIEALKGFRDLGTNNEMYFKQALQELETALYLDAFNDTAQYWIAKSYEFAYEWIEKPANRFPPKKEDDYKVNYLKQAVEEYNKLLSHYPKSQWIKDALWNLKNCYLSLWHHYYYMNYYLKTDTLGKANETNLAKLRVLKELAMRCEHDGYPMWEIRQLYLGVGSYRIAEEKAQEFVDFYYDYVDRHVKMDQSPDGVRIIFDTLYQCQEKLNGENSAIELLKKEAARYKDNKKAVLAIRGTLAEFYSKAKRYNQAIAEFKEVMALYSGDIPGYDFQRLRNAKYQDMVVLIKLLVQVENWQEAKKWCKGGIEESSVNPSVWWHDQQAQFYWYEALCCQKLNQWDEAIYIYETILREKRFSGIPYAPYEPKKAEEEIIKQLKFCSDHSGNKGETEQFLTDLGSEDLVRIDWKGQEWCLVFNGGGWSSPYYINAIKSDGTNVFCGGGECNKWHTSNVNLPGKVAVLYAYDKEKQEWKPCVSESVLQTESFTSIAIDGDYVWCTTAGDGVGRYDRKNNNWQWLTTKDGLFDNEIYCIAVDDNFIWLGGGQMEKPDSPGSSEYESGRCFDTGGIAKYDKKQKAWFTYVENVPKPSPVTALAVDGDYLWIGTESGSISRLNKVNKIWENLREGGEKCGYSKIFDIVVDKQSVWLGSEKGLLEYSKADKTLKLYTTISIFNKKGLKIKYPLEPVYTVAIDNDYLWAGSDDGLYVYSKKNKKWIAMREPSGYLTSIVVDDNFVWCLTTDSYKRIGGVTYTGCIGGRIYRYLKSQLSSLNW